MYRISSRAVRTEFNPLYYGAEGAVDDQHWPVRGAYPGKRCAGSSQEVNRVAGDSSQNQGLTYSISARREVDRPTCTRPLKVLGELPKGTLDGRCVICRPIAFRTHVLYRNEAARARRSRVALLREE